MGGYGQRAQNNCGGKGHRRHGQAKCGLPFAGPPPPTGRMRSSLDRARVGSGFGFQVSSRPEERIEARGGIGIAALRCTLERRLGIGEVSARREDHPQTTSRGGMAARVRDLIRPFCAVQVTAFFEQRAEVEGAIRLATLVRAGVALLRRTPGLHALRGAPRD